ncbi:hypothetical protein DFO66_1186 [Brevibacterium sanguinis]|uniref:Tetratricopeptide repeat protein n=2 Tax=Brevibacterium TaxID=1696 RepID=A0A366IEQ9_9MICO|nr:MULTISPECIES: hypothetical protein [Brevibacterium]RBP61873.1 hypothetical protein DFO66_1186 [Brevibacterium sanguinis]RBP68681.1 hypothetical protein DFO65_11651 [Brevibacterium celere]
MVAKHLVAAGGLLDLDPERAHQHAKAAMARAGRVGLVREALGIAAYHVEQYDEAVRELRTHRRISGSNENIALIADAERGRGKPEKAIEILEQSKELELDNEIRTELVIVAAGAKSDLGDLDGARALIEAEDFTQRPSGALVRLLAAYSEILRLHGETELADKYEELSRRTAKATGTLFGDEEPDPNFGVEIETIEELPDEDLEDGQREVTEGADAEAVGTTTDDAEAADDADGGARAEEPEAETVPAEDASASDTDVESSGSTAGTDEEASSTSEAFPEAAANADAHADDSNAPAEPTAAESTPAKSKTHVSDKELKKISVSEAEIEAELAELLGEDDEPQDDEADHGTDEQGTDDVDGQDAAASTHDVDAQDAGDADEPEAGDPEDDDR